MSETMCYIGIKPCGCVVAIVLDAKEHKKATANDVASFIRSGLTVEHTSTTDGKERFSPCTCDEKPEDDTMDLFEDAKT